MHQLLLLGSLFEPAISVASRLLSFHKDPVETARVAVGVSVVETVEADNGRVGAGDVVCAVTEDHLVMKNLAGELDLAPDAGYRYRLKNIASGAAE